MRGPFASCSRSKFLTKRKIKGDEQHADESAALFARSGWFIYVFGGQNNTNDIHNYVEKYDMNNGTHTTLTARMNFRRGSEFGICKTGTKVYLVGGSYKRSRKSKDTYTNKVEVFSLVNENLQLLKDLPKADGLLSSCFLCDE